MRPLHRIAAALKTEPWMITPGTFQTMLDQLDAAMRADDPVGPMIRPRDGGQPYPAHPQVEVAGNVAILPIHGVIGKYLSTLDIQCGGCDLEMCHRQLENVADDEAIDTIILDLNTPGGKAQGVPKFANAVAAVAAREDKQVIAFARHCCASAGYYIAAGASQILTTEEAIVGSISTLMFIDDTSEAFAERGIRRSLFSTGKFKSIGLPGVELTQEQESHVWEKIRETDEEFKGFIAERRGLASEHMEGQTWEARRAPEGMIDGTVENLESLVAALLK